MKRDSRSIFQFAALGAVVGVVFAVGWWIAITNGSRPHTRSVGVTITFVLAPFANPLPASDMPAIADPHDARAVLEYLGTSIVFNACFYGLLGTIAVITRGMVHSLLQSRHPN